MNIFSKEELNEFCNSNLSYKEKIYNNYCLKKSLVLEIFFIVLKVIL